MNKNIRVLIVEDEILIAEIIREYLSERGHVTSDIAISYNEAVQAIQTQVIDLVLLDIRLYGEKSGIDVSKYLKDNHPSIPYVFLTSQFDRRIVERAIDNNPAGYLTKPIQKESLWTTIETIDHNTIVTPENRIIRRKIELKDGDKSYIVFLDEIQRVEADHVYVNVYTKSNKRYSARYSLAQIAELLNSDQFIQCHRSHIVNVKSIKSYDHSTIKIDEIVIPISRSRKREVVHKIKNWV